MRYRTRFAPSPTGAMHLGHARTALVAWLEARRQRGAIVMRIEDIDTPRVRAASAESILSDHEWLGLDWDEGPVYQSSRFGRYEEIWSMLVARAAVYPCTCSRKEWMSSSAPHGDEDVLYPGTCRPGPSHLGRTPAWRFRMDEAEPFVDALHGAVAPGSFDDFIVRRSDGLWAYQLAVVVDDHDMAITEVVRGDDLLSSTPKQIALYRALAWQPPTWLHVPLVLGPSGARLAKRDGAVSIGDYRAAGWTRERVLGLLATSLGVPALTVDLDELRDRFDLARVPKDPFRLS